MLPSRHLHVVSPPPPPAVAPTPAQPGSLPDRGDLALLAMLFGVNVVPIVGDAVARGRWGTGTLGVAAAGALVTGRELVREALALVRSRRVRTP